MYTRSFKHAIRRGVSFTFLVLRLTEPTDLYMNVVRLTNIAKFFDIYSRFVIRETTFLF